MSSLLLHLPPSLILPLYVSLFLLPSSPLPHPLTLFISLSFPSFSSTLSLILFHPIPPLKLCFYLTLLFVISFFQKLYVSCSAFQYTIRIQTAHYISSNTPLILSHLFPTKQHTKPEPLIEYTALFIQTILHTHTHSFPTHSHSHSAGH